MLSHWRMHAPVHLNVYLAGNNILESYFLSFQFSSFQSLSCVRLFVTPWTAAHQASLSITSSRSPHTPMSIESVMPSNHLILCHPLLPSPKSFPASGAFEMSQIFASGGQSIGVSASASVLPMNTQDWSPLRWTDWISLQSKGLSKVFFVPIPHFKVQFVHKSHRVSLGTQLTQSAIQYCTAVGLQY